MDNAKHETMDTYMVVLDESDTCTNDETNDFNCNRKPNALAERWVRSNFNFRIPNYPKQVYTIG